MESKQTTPSVIAKLMGLDELQPQHVSHKPIKVLSEAYLRKSASIALLEKNSVHVNRSPRITAGKRHGTKHVSENEIHKTDVRNSQSIYDVKPIQSTVRAQLSFARQKNAYAINFHPIYQNCQANDLNDVLKDLHVTRYSGKMSAERNALRSIQKLGNGSGECGAEHLDELSSTHLELKGEGRNICTRIVVLKPNSKKGHNCEKGSFFIGPKALRQGSDKDYMQHGCCLKSEGNITENQNTSRGMEPLRHRFRDTGLVDNTAAPEESINVGISHRSASRSRSIVEDSLLPEALMTPSQGCLDTRKRGNVSNQFLNGSSFSREAKSKIFERWKTTKFFEVAVPGRRCTLGQMFAMHDGDAKPKSLYSTHKKSCSSESFCHQKDNSEFCTLVHSSKVSSTNKYIRNLASPTLMENSSVTDETPDSDTRIEASRNLSLCQKEIGADYNLSSSNIIRSSSHDILPLQLKQGVHTELKKDMHEKVDGRSSSDPRDDLTQRKSSYDFPEGELIFTCRASDSGSAKNLREINQPSPDSVLEPAFKEENDHVSELSNSHVLDLTGLAMKLHLLNNGSEEISLEGSVMSVSSDEDTEKGSVDLLQDYNKVWEPLRPEESRDFSYLIDVLDEAALFGLNLDMWCETWHEMEFPLSPSVFEALEKKYGKQTSWLKSERRLLFDHINYGLRAIADSYMDFGLSGKPDLRRRFNATLRKNDIEEELWMQLTLEKEAKRDSSEKAFASELKWLELEDEIIIICKDIVKFLFDELATEMCST